MLTWINTEAGLGLFISQGLADSMAALGREKYPKEFGGILMGRYIHDHTVALVEDIVLPSKYRSSHFYFERGSDGLRDVLKRHYSASPSLIYVGEWHTHPDREPEPSRTDFQAMMTLAGDPGVFICNPILLIIGLNKDNYKIGAYVFYNEKLLPYVSQTAAPDGHQEAFHGPAADDDRAANEHPGEH